MKDNSPTNEKTAGGNQAAQNSPEQVESPGSHSASFSDKSQETCADQPKQQQEQQKNAYLLKPKKGVSLKTLLPTLRKRFKSHFYGLKRAESIPRNKKEAVEELFKEKKLEIEFVLTSDDYYSKSESGQKAERLWNQIDYLERKYQDEEEQIQIVDSELWKAISTLGLQEGDDIIIQRRRELDERKKAQADSRTEIDNLRAQMQLLEKYDEENPTIAFLVESGKTHDAAYKGIEVLATLNCGVYQQQGRLVRIQAYQTSAGKKKTKDRVHRADGALILSQVDETYLVQVLSQKHAWEKYSSSERKNRPIDFPEKAARFILCDFIGKKEDQIPYLTGVICSPTIRTDGTLLQESGYDEESGFYIDPCGTTFPYIHERPTRDDAIQALGLLKDLLKDFPFDSSVSRSVAIAELMTGVVRRSLDFAPPFINDASTRSSGKTLLAYLVGYIATGKPPAMLMPTPDIAEMEKRYGAALMAGDPIICIDNVTHTMDDPCLCVITTSEEWRPRVLGESKLARVTTDTQFICTGNNFSVKGDLCSRFLKCRLLPDQEHPEEREFDRNLHEYTPRHRGELVAAILTIIRAYIYAGYPELKNIPPFRTFSDFTRFIRAPLVWLGEPDPYESTRELKEDDPETEELGNLFAAWYAILCESMTIRELLRIVNDPKRREADEKVQNLHDILSSFAKSRNGDEIDANVLGNKIKRHKDRIVNQFRLVAVGKDRVNATTWKVKKA
jgi:hypothetical protein